MQVHKYYWFKKVKYFFVPPIECKLSVYSLDVDVAADSVLLVTHDPVRFTSSVSDVRNYR